MIEKKEYEKIRQLSQEEVLRRVDGVFTVLEEAPGEGTDIIVVTWASNGDNFAQRDPDAKDVNVFGIFKGVSSNEYLIERGGERYGVSEGAPQGTHLAEDSVSTCPPGITTGVLNSQGKRIWSQTTTNRGIINLGIVILNVGYSNETADLDALLDRIHDMAVDAHEEVFFEYSTLTSGLDQLAYKTSGQAVDTWISAFKSRAELDWSAADRDEWSPNEVAFVNFVKSISEYRVILAIGNNVIIMLGLEAIPPPEAGYGYRNYNDVLVPLTESDSAIGKEFFVESDNGKIGLRVLGCDYHTGDCGIWFTYYNVDLSRVMIKEPCFLANAASSSPIDNRILRPAREFRDRYLKLLPQGKMFIDLYRAHSFEMWRLVTTDPEMQKKAKTLLPQLVSIARTWRESEPKQFDTKTIEIIKTLAEQMTTRASDQLKKSLNIVIQEVDKFEGLSLGQALLVLEEIELLRRHHRI